MPAVILTELCVIGSPVEARQIHQSEGDHGQDGGRAEEASGGRVFKWEFCKRNIDDTEDNVGIDEDTNQDLNDEHMNLMNIIMNYVIGT